MSQAIYVFGTHILPITELLRAHEKCSSMLLRIVLIAVPAGRNQKSRNQNLEAIQTRDKKVVVKNFEMSQSHQFSSQEPMSSS